MAKVLYFSHPFHLDYNNEVILFDIKEPFTGFEKNGELCLWLTRRLWELSKTLPVFDYAVDSFECFDKDVWFGAIHKPTVNKVLEHYRKIESARFEHPIILSQSGFVLDGVHRICRADLDGRKIIPAVRFDVDPEPDRKIPVEPKDGS